VEIQEKRGLDSIMSSNSMQWWYARPGTARQSSKDPFTGHLSRIPEKGPSEHTPDLEKGGKLSRGFLQ
jgi:hypothetical protein